jgi:hypothetical protein
MPSLVGHGLTRELWPEFSDTSKKPIGIKARDAYGRLKNPAAPCITINPELIPELR